MLWHCNVFKLWCCDAVTLWRRDFWSSVTWQCPKFYHMLATKHQYFWTKLQLHVFHVYCLSTEWRTEKNPDSITRLLDYEECAQLLGSKCCPRVRKTLLSSSFPSALLLIDFHTSHFCTYDCLLIRARTTSGTHREHLCWHFSNTPKA